MHTPDISIILSYRGESLPAVLCQQHNADVELIVPDRNQSGSLGSICNQGLEAARGEYVLFLSETDEPDPCLPEILLSAGRSAGADIVSCDCTWIGPGKREFSQPGIQTGWLKGDPAGFNLSSCPDFIMQIAPDCLGNRLYRREFLLRKGLRFDDLSDGYALSFGALSLAMADSITYLPRNLIRCRRSATADIRSLWHGVESCLDRVKCHPEQERIRNSVAKFAVNNLINGLKTGIRDFSGEDAAWFYRKVHALFNGPLLKDLTPAQLFNTPLYRDFQSVQKHDYETMDRMRRRKLIVSVTSYPLRIGLLAQSLQTIYNQTRKPDAVVLWLAKDQFPNGEEDLPADLRELLRQKKLLLRWCDDLKGHKKYFWAFREFRDDLVVTIDDDLLYPRDLLESLHKSYLLFPNAISAVRTHLMLVSEEGKLLPYSRWIMETDACMHEPTMQLMATGGAGTLYPPELFREEIFDQNAVEQTCLRADDLWLKAMELISDVPTVLARPFERLQFVPDSQEEALHNLNVGQNQNDVQMNNIIVWLDKHVGENILVKKLTDTDIGTVIHGVEALSGHLDRERKSNRWKKLTAELKNQELQKSVVSVRREKEKAEADRAGLECLLEQTRRQKFELEQQLTQVQLQWEQTQVELRQAERLLGQTQNQLRQERENAPIGRQLRNVGIALERQKESGGGPISWGFKKLVYLLAWVPEKMLACMMYYLRNGAKQTIKRIFHK